MASAQFDAAISASLKTTDGARGDVNPCDPGRHLLSAAGVPQAASYRLPAASNVNSDAKFDDIPVWSMISGVAPLVIALAAFGVAFYAGANSGCCLIPQASAAATRSVNVTTLHIEGMTCGSCATAVRARSFGSALRVGISFPRSR